MKVIVVTKFHLKLTIFIFWTKFVENSKSEHHHIFVHIRISQIPNFSRNSRFWFCGPNYSKKDIYY